MEMEITVLTYGPMLLIFTPVKIRITKGEVHLIKTE